MKEQQIAAQLAFAGTLDARVRRTLADPQQSARTIAEWTAAVADVGRMRAAGIHLHHEHHRARPVAPRSAAAPFPNDRRENPMSPALLALALVLALALGASLAYAVRIDDRLDRELRRLDRRPARPPAPPTRRRAEPRTERPNEPPPTRTRTRSRRGRTLAREAVREQRRETLLVLLARPDRTGQPPCAGQQAARTALGCVWVEGRVLDEDTAPERDLDGALAPPPFEVLPLYLLHEARRTARISETRVLRALGLYRRGTPLPEPCPW
ncbi:hypothetical protein [Streptomyces halstedii]|uniref:hypothetical protein n=1 Tax=Streptomyces halstedii TaxID=1944 RepID=UPI0019440635|nr:hypothetical protein [Streptomyces halstedii]